MSAVQMERRGSVAVLTLNNPPVNGLGAVLRTDLAKALDSCLADPAVTALVVVGGGRMYSAGADIHEFDEKPPAGTPGLGALIDRMEAADKPIVAAIHGVAAGGGLELALGCHHRIAAPGTRLGLPEVTLGILPVAGGTQRLPRLAGVETAMDMIVSGRLVSERAALKSGIIDAVADDPLAAAIEAAGRLAGTTPRRSNEQDAGLQAGRDNPGMFDAFRKGMAKSARGMNAPYACLRCVEAATRLPFAEGLRFEREEFGKLVDDIEAQAMRHAFFAERDVSKIPDVPPGTPALKIETAGVVGCGTMGGGIAMVYANAGIPVTVVESNDAALDAGLEKIRANYAATVSRGRLSQVEMDRRLGLITGATDFAALADADIVVEAVFEEMAIKHEVFGKLDAICKPGAILATNTSTLDVNEIAAGTKRPESVIGTHYFSPANVMRLLENVRGAKSSKQTVATVMGMSKRLGKVGVLVGVCHGFVGNRMLHQYSREANFLVEEGATPQQVDKVIYDFGFPMGPFQMGDLAGLDVGWRIRKARAAEHPSNLRYAGTIGDRICEMGRFGQKTGAGWYRYEKGDRTPIPDPEIEALIAASTAERGIQRRPIADEEILARCLYPLVNEGAKILEEGLALRASDIDVIWIHGYGFPRYRGGPMFWADHIGLDKIYDAMSRFHAVHGEWMRPSPLLERLAKEGKGFGDL
jgi:3-hydroxyacyl-CoA dehydrogenase